MPARPPGRRCPPGPTGPRPFRPAIRGRAPPPGAELPHRRASGAGTARRGTRGPAASSAPPALQARRAHVPLARPFLRGTAARQVLPASPHIIGVPARELADILVHVLEAFLGFLQLLLQRAHRHRHPAAARPGRAPREAALGNRGNRPRPLRWPRAGTAQPIAPPWPPLTANHRAREERARPSGWLAKSAQQSQSPGADWHFGRPTSGRLFLLAGRINERACRSDMTPS